MQLSRSENSRHKLSILNVFGVSNSQFPKNINLICIWLKIVVYYICSELWMDNTLSIEEIRERSLEMRHSDLSKRIKARVALGKRGARCLSTHQRAELKKNGGSQLAGKLATRKPCNSGELIRLVVSFQD